MLTLPEVVAEAAVDLDPAGDGFQTGELAKVIFKMVSADCGFITENGKQLMREGAQRRATRFQPPRRRLARKLGNTNQRDMVELDPTFAFFVQEWVGLDEGGGAIRKSLLKMTLPEFQEAIKLNERKAAQTAAKADAMTQILLTNPAWQKNPKCTLGKLLKIVVADEVMPRIGAQPSPELLGADA